MDPLRVLSLPAPKSDLRKKSKEESSSPVSHRSHKILSYCKGKSHMTAYHSSHHWAPPAEEDAESTQVALLDIWLWSPGRIVCLSLTGYLLNKITPLRLGETTNLIYKIRELDKLRKKRTMFKLKEKNKISEKELKATEVSNLLIMI